MQHFKCKESPENKGLFYGLSVRPFLGRSIFRAIRPLSLNADR